MSRAVTPLPAGAAEPLALLHAACFPEDPWDAEALRRSPNYKVLTPDQCIALARDLGPAGSLTFRPLAGGMDPKIIEDIRHRRVPHFDDPKAQAIYDVAKSLHETHVLPKPLYDHATNVLGERGLVEIIGLCGYYTLVSMTLNTYEFDLPEGEISDLAE